MRSGPEARMITDVEADGLRDPDPRAPRPRDRDAHRAGARRRSRVPLPTVSKLAKELSKAGLVISHRGRNGGYGLARPAEAISIAEIVEALEGPIALTECAKPGGSSTAGSRTPASRRRAGTRSRARSRTRCAVSRSPPSRPSAPASPRRRRSASERHAS